MRVPRFIQRIMPFLAPPPKVVKDQAYEAPKPGLHFTPDNRYVGKALARHRQRRKVLHRISRASRQRNNR